MRTFATGLRTSYRPSGIYLGPLHFVYVSDPRLDEETNRTSSESTLEDWRRWTGTFVPWKGPGNHVTILTPAHVQALVEWWKMSRVADNERFSETENSPKR
jgi:arthrofactin-type cyclic lipopeptide synthetase C